MNAPNPADNILEHGFGRISEALNKLIHQNVSGDKFTPRRIDWNTVVPAGGVATTASAVSVCNATPNAGKIWELRAVSLYSTDPTHGSATATPGTAAFFLGNPPVPDGTVLPTATLAATESFYYDSIAGSAASALFGPGGVTIFSGEVYWVQTGQYLYSAWNAAAGTITGLTNLIARYYVQEYDSDQILHGVMSTNSVHPYTDRGILPRSQA